MTAAEMIAGIFCHDGLGQAMMRISHKVFRPDATEQEDFISRIAGIWAVIRPAQPAISTSAKFDVV